MAESVAALLRVSSSGQDEENQRPELDAYCYEHGYRINYELLAHDVSASSGALEPWLEEALALIKAGEITRIVVVHSSRLDRRHPDIAQLYYLTLRLAGGRVDSVREPMFGKDDLAGQFVTLLAHITNHDDIQKLKANVAAGHEHVRLNRRTLGVGMFGRAPFGYAITGEKFSKVLVPTPLGEQYVPEMFERIAAKQSLKTVADWLNSENVPTGTSTPTERYGFKPPRWHAATVRAIICNPAYKGQMRKSNGDYFGECPRLVSAAVWNDANDRLAAAPTRRGPTNDARRSMLSAALFCACGSAMYRSTSETRVYYRCAGKVTGQSCAMIPLTLLDAAVDQIMTGNKRHIRKRTRIPGINYDDEIDATKSQLKSLDPDDPDYDDQHAELRAELRRLRDLDTTPDTFEMRPTAETWGDRWSSVTADAERGPWLVRHGFRVTANKAGGWVEVAEAAKDGDDGEVEAVRIKLSAVKVSAAAA
jgi:DNA invertase Pin-like site-specific DNA recombinase